MSRNLTTSFCVECDNPEPVRLTDIIGQPIELRALGNSPPQMGTRWNCPQCDRAYFVIWRPAEWSHGWRWRDHENEPWFQRFSDGKSLEEQKKLSGVPPDVDYGWSAGFVLDLSYYESYNDEPGYNMPENQPPRGLVTNNREQWQWLWGNPSKEDDVNYGGTTHDDDNDNE